MQLVSSLAEHMDRSHRAPTVVVSALAWLESASHAPSEPRRSPTSIKDDKDAGKYAGRTSKVSRGEVILKQEEGAVEHHGSISSSDSWPGLGTTVKVPFAHT
eukprot:2947029-Rhodomonas_salina.2